MTFILAECYFSHAEELLHFTVSCTSTAMPFFLSSASTDGSIRSRRAPVPSTRISAGKIKVKRASSVFTLSWSTLDSPCQNQLKSMNLFKMGSILIPLSVVLLLLFGLPILGSIIWKSETLSSVMSAWLPIYRHGKTQAQTKKYTEILYLNKPINHWEGLLKDGLTFHWRMAGGSTAHGPSTLLPSMIKPCEL